MESIPILAGQEEDGRWWADIESMPGVMAYGTTQESAIAAVRALALRVAADCVDHGEDARHRNRVGRASRTRPPTPPYVLVVYGGFFKIVTSHTYEPKKRGPVLRTSPWT